MNRRSHPRWTQDRRHPLSPTLPLRLPVMVAALALVAWAFPIQREAPFHVRTGEAFYGRIENVMVEWACWKPNRGPMAEFCIMVEP